MERYCPHCGRFRIRAVAVSIRAACKLLGLGKTTFYALQTRAAGPPISRPPGSRPLVRVSALEEWVKHWEGPR